MSIEVIQYTYILLSIAIQCWKSKWVSIVARRWMNLRRILELCRHNVWQWLDGEHTLAILMRLHDGWQVRAVDSTWPTFGWIRRDDGGRRRWCTFDAHLHIELRWRWRQCELNVLAVDARSFLQISMILVTTNRRVWQWAYIHFYFGMRLARIVGWQRITRTLLHWHVHAWNLQALFEHRQAVETARADFGDLRAAAGHVHRQTTYDGNRTIAETIVRDAETEQEQC